MEDEREGADSCCSPERLSVCSFAALHLWPAFGGSKRLFFVAFFLHLHRREKREKEK